MNKTHQHPTHPQANKQTDKKGFFFHLEWSRNIFVKFGNAM